MNRKRSKPSLSAVREQHAAQEIDCRERGPPHRDAGMLGAEPIVALLFDGGVVGHEDDRLSGYRPRRRSRGRDIVDRFGQFLGPLWSMPSRVEVRRPAVLPVISKPRSLGNPQSRLVELGLDGGPDASGRQLSHALEPPALLQEAGCAPDAALNRGDTRAEWPGKWDRCRCRFRRLVRRPPRPDAVVRCRWRASGRTRQQSPQAGAGWSGRKGRGRSPAGIGAATRRRTGGPRRSRRRSSRRLFRDGPASDLREVLGRPALGRPTRAQVENDAGRGHARQRFLCPKQVVATDRQMEPRLRHVRPSTRVTRRTRSTA